MAGKHQPYECPRCGYLSYAKQPMQRHLFGRQKKCQSLVADIKLTDEIKQTIMESRRYVHDGCKHTNTPQPPVVQVNFNTNTNFMAFVESLDIVKTLGCMLKHQDKRLLDIETTIDNRYFESPLQKALCSNDHIHSMNTDDDVINLVSKTVAINKGDGIENMNIICNKETKTLQIFDDGNWTVLNMDQGTTLIIQKIKERIFDEYEMHLIRMWKNNPSQKQRAFDYITEHFRILAACDIDPYMLSHDDDSLLFETHEDGVDYSVHINNFSIRDELVNLFVRLQRETTNPMRRKFMNKMKSAIESVIHKNQGEFYRQVAELVGEPEFKTKLLALG